MREPIDERLAAEPGRDRLAADPGRLRGNGYAVELGEERGAGPDDGDTPLRPCCASLTPSGAEAEAEAEVGVAAGPRGDEEEAGGAPVWSVGMFTNKTSFEPTRWMGMSGAAAAVPDV